MRFACLLLAASVTLTTTIDGRVIHAQTPAPAPLPAKPNPNAEPETILLWSDGAPGALGTEDADRPTLTIYRARQPSGASVIVAPGGGYSALASNHEGRQVANLLNAAGVTAFVLKYRLGPKYHHPIELGDAQRAIRLVRARAQEFGVAPDRIGIMGFSAGGHLAATAGTHFDAGKTEATDPIDRAGCRPDFLILAYPVVSFDPAIAHSGSVRNLLGENPDPKLVEDLSNDLRVTSAHAADVSLSHQRRHRSRRREQRPFLSGVAPGQGAGRAPHLREWPPWRRTRAGRSVAFRLACALDELASREGAHQVGRPGLRARSPIWSDHFAVRRPAEAGAVLQLEILPHSRTAVPAGSCPGLSGGPRPLQPDKPGQGARGRRRGMPAARSGLRNRAVAPKLPL